ncbi:hypothetical protein AB0A95_34515 [Micromonospora sp. NPDC049230]|uniref:hypothetical protein n=1 Tax=Micromonospora sp. NPDC049230 TaxID=3155502 RepID=UPI0033DB732A
MTLAGCSSAESPPPNPFEAEFERAKRQASSEFEHAVLEDSTISRAEYQESIDRFLRCMNDNGIEATALPARNGTFTYRWPKAQGNDDTESKCRVGTTMHIEPLYIEIVVNPKNEDRFELMVRCLARESLVPPGYTTDDLQKDMSSGYANAPFDHNSTKVMDCMSGPA